MQVITLSQVKTQLGITDTTHDAAITAQLPAIDAKVKLITNRNFNYQFIGNIESGSDLVEIASTYEWHDYDVNGRCYNSRRRYDRRGYWGCREPELYLERDIPVGTVVVGDGIPADAYIMETYYNGTNGVDVGDSNSTPFIKLSTDATKTINGVYLYAGINISWLPIISKGVWWLISQVNTDINDNAWTSRSVGPLSVSRGNIDNRLDSRSGMPAWFVKSLPRYHR